MNLMLVVVALTLFGAGLYCAGIYAETHHQMSLRARGGDDAVVQYRNALPEQGFGKASYVASGLRGDLDQIGANAQVAGMAIMYAGSGLILILSLIARGIWAVQVRLSPVAGRSWPT
jgi:hypothetical protein